MSFIELMLRLTSSVVVRCCSAAVKTISEMNTQIASAAEQQRTTTEEVSRSIISINDISRATAEGAYQTTATSRELFTLSQQLGDLVGQFKLDR